VGFRVGLVAARAAIAAESVPVLSEALAFDLAGSASHCFRCFCLTLHTSIIQRLAVVCQRKSWQRAAVYFLCFEWLAWDRMGLRSQTAKHGKRLPSVSRAFLVWAGPGGPLFLTLMDLE